MSQNSSRPERGEEQPVRDGRGRFLPGNPGGPGNPYGRRVAELKKAMLAAISEADIAEIISMMATQAKLGDRHAARLVLEYTVGKPAESAEPDHVDKEGWEIVKNKPTAQEAEEVFGRMPLGVANAMNTSMEMAMVAQVQARLAAEDAGGAPAAEERATEPRQRSEQRGERNAPRREKRAPEWGMASESPSPNGDFPARGEGRRDDK